MRAEHRARVVAEAPGQARHAEREHGQRQRVIVDGDGDTGEREQDRDRRPEAKTQSRSQHGRGGVRTASEGAGRPGGEAQVRRERQQDREVRREREAPEAGLAQPPPREDQQPELSRLLDGERRPLRGHVGHDAPGLGDGGRRHARPSARVRQASSTHAANRRSNSSRSKRRASARSAPGANDRRSSASSADASDAGVASWKTAPPSPSRMRVGRAALGERDHGPPGGQRLDRERSRSRRWRDG